MWCRTKIRTAPPHSRPVRPPRIEPLSARPNANGKARPSSHPCPPHPVDHADDRLVEQIRRVARLVRALGVEEQPPEMRVEQAAQRAADVPTVVDMRRVRIAFLVGERVVLAVRRDPCDHRSLEGGGPKHAEQPRNHRGALNDRCVKCR